MHQIYLRFYNPLVPEPPIIIRGPSFAFFECFKRSA